MRLSKKHAEQITAILPADTKPLVLHSVEEQRQLLKTWREALKTGDQHLYVGLSEVHSGGAGAPSQPRLSVRFETQHRGYDTVWTNIFFNDSGELTLGISNLKKEWALHELAQVRLVEAKFTEFFEEQHKQSLKHEKVRKLKTNSIVAHLEEIARADGFEYAYEQSTRQVTLFVKLSARDALSIRVPFSNFQEVMQRLRPSIQIVRELAEGGIVFQIKQASYMSWISPKK